MRDWWRARTLGFQLAATMAAVGLLLLVVNAAILTAFLNRYVFDQEGTTLAHQAFALSRCAPDGVANGLLAGGPAARADMQPVLFAGSRRHAVVIDGAGRVRYVSSMSSLVRVLLVRLLQDDLRHRHLRALPTPSWRQTGGELVVDELITCRLSPAPAASSVAVYQAGGLLLAEDEAVPVGRWRELVNLIIVVGLLATALGVLAALALGNRMARSVRAAASAARAVAGGEYERRLGQNGSAELTDMGMAFNSMVEQVERQRRIERDLLANISHELASPIGLIRGYAEALADNVLATDDARSAALRAIRDESTRLQRLTQDLLDLALLETGQVSMHVEEVPLNELLRGLRERVTPLAQRAGVTISVEAAPGLPRLPVDVQRLEQVLINLLNNALRHTPSGGTITLAARQQGEGLEISVSDTGSGIPSEELPRIWERFYRVEKDRDRRGPAGLGLGLAISRSTVDLMHGTIEVESTVGVGTTFRIWLPLSDGGSGRVAPV